MAMILAAGLGAGCAPQGGVAPQSPLPGSPWKGVETRLLQDDLVNFRVAMSGRPSREALSDYARCAAAQYAAIRGFGFARHIRTTYEAAGEADAVYLVSGAVPSGIRTIDAEITLADCRARGIPTV